MSTYNSDENGFPGLKDEPLPAELYYTEESYAKERDSVFRRCWMVAGIGLDIPRTGDFFVKHIPTFDVGLIFIRQKDGTVKGFYNACQHRGNPVCLEKKGHKTRFVCRFHSWSYGEDGALLYVPDEESFPGLKKENYALKAVRTEMWGGFIFFNLDDGAENLVDYLGGVAEMLSDYPFQDAPSTFTYGCEVNSNWKSVLDAGSETYHVGSLHRDSIARVMVGKDNKFGRLVAGKALGRHRHASYWADSTYKPSPLEKLVSLAAPRFKILAAGGGETTALVKGLNPSNSKGWSQDTYAIFPSILVQINGSAMVTQQVWPISVDRSYYEFRGFFPEARNAAERFAQEHTKVQIRDILSEDLTTLERMQRNYKSGAVKTITFSKEEVLLRHQYSVVMEHIGRLDGV